jgi:hypothetical protein
MCSHETTIPSVQKQAAADNADTAAVITLFDVTHNSANNSRPAS